MMKEILLLITTELDKDKAKNLATLLIEKKLAACVSIKDIFSVYKWEDNIEENKEVEITIKSKQDLKDDLILFLKKNLSYKVPQIIYKNFHTEKEYYDWLNSTF